MPETTIKKTKSLLRKLLPWLVVLILLLCPLAICMPFYLQAHAIQTIENKGGVVGLDDEVPLWIPQEIADWIVETDWLTEEKQRYFCEVREVNLDDAKFSNDDFRYLSRFTKCTYINGLDKFHIKDQGLKHLRWLTRLKELTLSHSHVTNEGLAHISQMVDVERLELADTCVTDAGLRHLSQMIMLGKLDLENTKITGSGFKQLSGLTNITDLLLINTNVNNAGLKQIGRHTNLSNLNLSNTKVTDEGLKHLSRLSNLNVLNLSGTKISDAGLKHLSHLTSLTVLDLSDTKITGSGLKHLSKLSIIPEPGPIKKQEVGKFGGGGFFSNKGVADFEKLKNLIEAETSGLWKSDTWEWDGLNLDLSESQINDDGLKHVSQLLNLRSLNLKKTQVSDAGLHHLSHLKNLRFIDLDGSKVTSAGIKQLQKALPDCKNSRPYDNTTLNLIIGGGLRVHPARISLTNFCLVISAIVIAICLLLFFTVRFLFFQSD